MLNLDANASFGLLPEVVEFLRSATGSSHGLNPSSIHQGGQRARAQIEEARAALGDLVGLSEAQRLVFTSGATESNATVIASCFDGVSPAPDGEEAALVLSAIEHPCVIEPAQRLREKGFRVAEIAPHKDGTFCGARFAERVGQGTRLVTVMLANNESGQVLPVSEIATACRRESAAVWVHSDCSQALGKIPLAFTEVGADSISLSGHKIGALPGVGALVMNVTREVAPLFLGGVQEGRARAGTENVLGISTFGIAARVALRALATRAQRMEENREQVRRLLRELLPQAALNWDTTPRLPNTLSIYIPGVPADDLVVALDLQGFLISSGAACASGKPEPSATLMAMGFSEARARSTVRVSLTGNESSRQLAGLVSEIARFSGARNSLHAAQAPGVTV